MCLGFWRPSSTPYLDILVDYSTEHSGTHESGCFTHLCWILLI
jgi:hypothetical protein